MKKLVSQIRSLMTTMISRFKGEELDEWEMYEWRRRASLRVLGVSLSGILLVLLLRFIALNFGETHYDPWCEAINSAREEISR